MSTPAALDLAFACPAPDCGESVEGRLTAGTAAMTCSACQTETTLPETEALLASRPLTPCPVCGCTELYSQRDFNRKVGLLIVAIGCVLGPWTNWISVVVAILIDFALWMTVPQVAICYSCNAQFRRFAKDRRPGDFDIAVHDVYKFGRRFAPRRERAVAGPKVLHELWTGGPKPGPGSGPLPPLP